MPPRQYRPVERLVAPDIWLTPVRAIPSPDNSGLDQHPPMQFEMAFAGFVL